MYRQAKEESDDTLKPAKKRPVFIVTSVSVLRVCGVTDMCAMAKSEKRLT